jgi:hypothetical protein
LSGNSATNTVKKTIPTISKPATSSPLRRAGATAPAPGAQD